MNNTELRESFKHIHGYQDWQRQCEALVAMLDTKDAEIARLHFEINTVDLSHRDLAHRLAEAGRDNERLRAAILASRSNHSNG